MKVGLISSCIPLVYGGGRNIVDWLHVKLQEHGQQSECIYIPNTDDPEFILEQMTAFRLLQLEEYFDRIVTFRPPSHLVRHSHKVVWFIHHIRLYYDLWNTPYRSFPDTAPLRALRAKIMYADTMALTEARQVFTNSRTVGERLMTFNGIRSDVLYPPILNPELFQARDYGDEIVCVSRIEPHKRQHLLVEAMRFVRSGVRLRLCGDSLSHQYMQQLRATIEREALTGKVVIDDRWISEEEKAQRVGSALAAAYVPYDEDSYGYPTIEAAHARRCTVTLADAGGVLEFVKHRESGLVEPPQPEALAAAFDRLYTDRKLARDMGDAAHERLDELGINWQNTLGRLLS